MPTAPKPVLRCKTTVSAVAVSPDGTRVLWAGGDPRETCPVVVCDAMTGKTLLTLLGHKKPVLHAWFLDDGSVVSFGFDAEVRIWKPSGELKVSNGRHQSHRADACAISRDGKTVVAGDYHGTVRGWKTSDGSEAFTFAENGERQQVWAAALSPKGDLLATGGAGGRVRLWGMAKRKAKAEVEFGRGRHVHGLAWHPAGGRLLAAVAPDGLAEAGAKSRVLLLDGATLRELAAFMPGGHQPYCCAFGPGGRLIAAAGGGTDRGGSESKKNCVVHVWDAETGEPVAEFDGHTGLVRGLAFAPDGLTLFSAGWDQTVRRWELPG